jgi:predicted Zn-dependent protease
MVGLPWIQTIGASTGMIVALASPTAGERPFNWARVLKHEFVHIVTLQQTNFNIPHWYTEALAVQSEGYPRPEIWNQLLVERVPRGELFHLDTINQAFARPKTPLDWQMAYCQSRLYAEYLEERFGPDVHSRLLAAYRENPSTARALESVLGTKQSDFEAGYREYLRKIVEGLKGSPTEEKHSLAELEKAHRAAPEDAAAASRYALALLEINRRKDARKLAEGALAKNRGEPLAAVVMARLALRGEDLAEALSWLEPALDREAPHPRVLSLLAEVKMRSSQFLEAADLYALGLARWSDHVPWLKGQALALLKAKDTTRVKGVLERLVATDADDAAARQHLAQMALDNKNFDEAAHFARLALHIDVLDAATHRLLALASGGEGDAAAAALEWQTACELKPEDAALAVESANALVALGRKDDATLRLTEFLKRKPDNAEVRKLLDELSR